jgi:hypothetical protein
MEQKTCLDCKHCLLEDFGYSNWTVEGTTVHCMKSKHPDNPFDRWYGEDKRLLYANECKSFKRGDLQQLDVDGEDWADLSAKAKRYLKSL